MPDLFPGVRSVSTRLSGPRQAASRAVELAWQAAASGTFGVGGILADRSGQVLAESINAVIEHGRVEDPTAHVERQLVDWYFEARRRGTAAAPPEDLVIVTSLDPCAMCAGAILLSGLNCIAVAEDPTSGVHKDGKPTRMPEQLRERAARRMAFFAVSGRRPRIGADLGPCFAGDISGAALTDATTSFTESLDRIRELIGSGEGRSEVTGRGTNDLVSLQSALPEGIWISPNRDLTEWSADRTWEWLTEADDRSVIVDGGGHVIAGADGYEERSPARTSVLELIRAYPTMRRLAADRLHLQLPHQRYCSIVKRRPPVLPETAMMELGAVGSFLEQPRLASGMPALAFMEWNGESTRITSWAASLPPFYTDIVAITVGPARPLLDRS